MKKIIVALTVMLTSTTLMAAPKNTTAEAPRNLHVYDSSGATYVDHVADQCSSSRYYLNPNHVQYKTIVSILLAAQLSGRSVVLRYDGCTSQNQGKIIGVFFK